MSFFDPTTLPTTSPKKAKNLWDLLSNWKDSECIDYYDGPLTLICKDSEGQRWWLETFGEEWKENIHLRQTWLCVPISESEEERFFDKKLSYRNIKINKSPVYFLHVHYGWKGKNNQGVYQWKQPLIKLHVANSSKIPENWLPEADVYFMGKDLE